MSTANLVSEPAALHTSKPSIDQLMERLGAEVDAAEKRVQSLQSEAAKVIVGRDRRMARFVAVADQIDAILRPRLEAMRSLDVFKDFAHGVRLEAHGPHEESFHARMTVLTVPCSDRRPTPMEFSFRVGHDSPIKNAVLDYRLEILPIFIKFDSHEQLMIPLDDPQEPRIAEWIDERLVGFTKTYFEVYFNNEYQRKTLETDPVLNLRFPKAFAAGNAHFQSQTYYFYTTESLQVFQKEPLAYIRPS